MHALTDGQTDRQTDKIDRINFNIELVLVSRVLYIFIKLPTKQNGEGKSEGEAKFLS